MKLNRRVTHFSIVGNGGGPPDHQKPDHEKPVWKTIKLGKASFPVCASTYEDLKALRALTNNKSFLGTVQFVLDNTTAILVEKQRLMLKSLSDLLGDGGESRRKLDAFVSRYCEQNGLTEAEAGERLIDFLTEFYGRMGYDFDHREAKDDGAEAVGA